MADTRSFLKGSARTVGRVRAVEPEALIITTPTGQTQQIATTPSTVVVKAARTEQSGLDKGSRVVVKNGPGGREEAREVIVLPSDNKHGLPVHEVAPDSITVTHMNGDTVTIATTDAAIDATAPASMSDVTDGATVFVQMKGTVATDLVAEEIIVLPADTAFGT